MKIVKPNYFDEFYCLADKCKNTCCKNWEIEIDSKSLLKYSNTCELKNIDDYLKLCSKKIKVTHNIFRFLAQNICNKNFPKFFKFDNIC